MSKKKHKVPKLRFPGFTGNWEQRKLSDFTERVVRKNGAESDRPLTISAQDGLIDQREYFNRQVASKDMSNYYLIKNGEFAYNKSYSEGYPFGAVKRLDYYESGALSTLYIVFKLIDTNVLSDFIIAYYMTHLWYGEISKRASEGARNHGILNISPADFFQSEMLIPTNVNEQCLIGKFFENFDNLITLHQRKLENLKLKKKALLQKLFPKNGEQFPELRFPGFTDAWEQRKLGEITDVRDGTHASPKFYNDGFPLVTSKNLKDGRINFSGCSLISKDDYEEINKRSKVELGDILFGMIGTIGNPVIVDSTGFAIKNVALIKLSQSINNKFIYHLLTSNVFVSYIARTNVGGTQKFIALNQIRDFDFLAPNIEEQEYIVNILDAISNLITLHQRKLEHLQLQKKALLQQMFV